MKRINQINYSPVYDEEKRRYENTFFLEFVCLLFTECKVSFPSWKFHAKNQNTISFYSAQFREYNSVSTCCSLVRFFFFVSKHKTFSNRIWRMVDFLAMNCEICMSRLSNLVRISSGHDCPWTLWLDSFDVPLWELNRCPCSMKTYPRHFWFGLFAGFNFYYNMIKLRLSNVTLSLSTLHPICLY